jgi:Putative Ig domain/Bacterial Ig domain
VLSILLIGATMSPHALPVSQMSPAGQFSNAISSGVLMALQHTTRSSNRMVSLASGDDTQVSTGSDPQNEPSMALNPANPQILAAGANDQLATATWLAVYTSSNGGLTWTSKLIPQTGLTGFTEASDPAVAFSENGTLYYSGLVFKIDARTGVAVDGTVFLSKSTDNGSSFPQTTIVAAGSSRVFNDKPYLTVDQASTLYKGRVYVSWTRFAIGGTSSIMVAYSSDGGRTFSSPVSITNSLLNQGSVPVVSPDGSLYVVWNDLSNSQILEAKSPDGGVSFSLPFAISSYVPLPQEPHFLANSFFRVNNNPTAAADDTNGNVYIAWADYHNGYANILSSRSLDGGITWTNPIKVNDDATTHDHFFPWMSVSHGILSVDFYDRRLDSQNHLVDVFYAESIDNGASFSSNVRVTDVSFNPDAIIFPSGESFIGDYIGIASNGTLAHPVWTEIPPSSPGNEDIFTEGRKVDRPPVVAPIRNQVVNQGTELRFGVTATDANVGETLALTALGAPSGAAFTSTPSTTGVVTGSFDWNVSLAQAPGSYSVEFQASNGLFVSSANASITVRSALAPSLAPISNRTIDDETLLTFKANATDPNIPAKPLTFSLGSDAPVRASITSGGVFSWTPNETQGGSYQFTVTVSNGAYADSEKVNVTVIEVNQPPVLSVPGPQTVGAGNLLIFSVSATSPDSDDVVALSAAGLPSGASFDPELGSFVWTPSTGQGPGVYTVTFRAVEPGPNGLSDARTVKITVNQPSSSPGQPFSVGGLGPGLLLAAVVTILVAATLSALAIRERRDKTRAEEAMKSQEPSMTG